MKTPDMAKENNFVLREAAKAACDGYYTHLVNGGKGDPAEERWIEALTAGADAIERVADLKSRLAQVERERDALEERIHGECNVCVNGKTAMCNDCIHNEWAWHPKHDYWELDGACKEKEEEE